MTVEDKRDTLAGEDDARDRFPSGMRVLAVDDDSICLKLLENLLRKCQYQVTTTNQSITALKMLRENRNRFDLVISDVNMPDMDGFKLLELVGLEMDLPVIMLSAHSDTKLVMKGITHGACDYLLKPVRMEELKNIWQHVVRRKKLDSRDPNKSSNQEKPHVGTAEGGQGATSSGQTDQNGKVNKKRKEQSEDEEEEDEENENENVDSSSQKKPRVVWSVELHRKFVAAVNQLGLEKAVPKKILDMMNIEGLTRENVASHLQKYRLYLKRISNVATPQANMVAAFGGKDPSYLRIGQLDGFGDFGTLTGPGRLSTSALSSYPQGGMLGRLNSPSGLGLRGIGSSSMIQPGHPQNSSNSMNNFGKLQETMLPANQNANLFQGTPTSLELNQLPQSKSTTHAGAFTRINEQTVFTVPTSFPDARVTLGSSSNSMSNASSKLLMLQANAQQTQSRGAFGNQSSLGAAPVNTGPFDMGVRCSSNLLDHSRLNESWQGAAQLSKFSSNPLPLSEPFSYNQVPLTNLRDNISITSSQIGNSPVDFFSSVSVSTPLEDSRGDLKCQTGLIGIQNITYQKNVIQNISCSAKQRWEENTQNYNHSLNNTFSNVDSLGSSGGVLLDQSNAVRSKGIDVIQNISFSAKQRWEENRQDYNHSLNNTFCNVDSLGSSSGVLLDQSNAVRSKGVDVSLVGQSNGGPPYVVQHAEGEKSALDTKLRSNEDYLFDQAKSQDGFIHNNYESLDDIMSVMMKRDQNGITLMDGEFGFDAYSLGSCL